MLPQRIPGPVAGPRCDGVADRWTLGSRRLNGERSTSLMPTAFSRGQAIESA